MKKRILKYLVYSIIPLILVFVLLYISNKGILHPKEETFQESPIKESSYLYGINIDSLSYIKDTIKSGENLSTILNRYGIDAYTIDQLVKKSKDVFDFRKIRSGNPYTILHDSTGKTKCFIYEDNPVDYIVCQIGDSIHIYSDQKEITTTIRSSAGEISSSLWNAMTESNTSPMLALLLSDIYAWTIDFYGIQKGDQFKAIYEERFVDDQSIGLGKIISCWFKSTNDGQYAFYFTQDSIGDYFDEEGNSLRKEFLKAPLSYARISSRFSNSRLHPVLKIRRPHHGIDYAAPTGTPVQSIGDGVVIKKGWSGGGGKTIKIKHNSTYTTIYMHLSRYGKGISVGSRVKQGDIIGYVGSTGLSTGPHLDFRVYKNGSPIDPLKMKSPPAKPVKEEYKEKFKETLRSLKTQLDNITIPQKEEIH